MKKFSKDIDIYYEVWDQVESPKGLVQIFHGMAEHVMRYEDFANFLNNNGYIVYGMDKRGHGQTGESSSLGKFSDENGWEKVLEDQKDLFEIMKKQFPNLKCFLLGHSMGSFFARNYINLYPEDFDGAIIMGTGKADDPSYKAARIMLKFFKDQKPAKLMDKLAFGAYNKEFKNPRTNFDWLSRDEKQVDKYIEDKYCGFMMTNSFYKDFMKGMKYISELEEKATFNKNLLFVAGDKDPVGKNGRSVNEAAQKYTHARVILYEDMRHEILNEIDNLQVYKDILDFLEENSR